MLGSVICQSCDLEQVTSPFCSVVYDAEFRFLEQYSVCLGF